MKSDSIINKIEKLDSEISIVEFENILGIKTKINRVDIFRRFHSLLDINNLQKTSGKAERKLLLKFILMSKLIHIDDRLLNFETEEYINLNNKNINLRDYYHLIKKSSDSGLENALLILKTRYDKLLLTRYAILQQQILPLGYHTFTEYFKDTNILFKKSDTIDLIKATDSMYKEIDKLNFKKLDETYVFFNTKSFDETFTQKNLNKIAYNITKLFGFSDSIKLHTENKKNKVNRAVALALTIPSDIHIIINSIGGLDDYVALLHELGHAMYYSNKVPDAYLKKSTSDPAISEAYAFLFESLISNPLWLNQKFNLSSKQTNKIIKLRSLRRLLSLRICCASFLYELFFYNWLSTVSHDVDLVIDKFVNITQNVLHFDAKDYVFNFDPDFYRQNYIRAYILEAQIRYDIEKKFGLGWFNNPEAVAFIKNLFEDNNKLEQYLETLDYSFLLNDLYNGININK